MIKQITKRILRILLTSLMALASKGSFAQTTCTSTGSGNWNTSGIWSCSGSGTPVKYVIATGHSINVSANVTTPAIDSVVVVGTLTFSNARTLTLNNTAGIRVATGGTISGGNASSGFVFSGAGSGTSILGPFNGANTVNGPAYGNKNTGTVFINCTAAPTISSVTSNSPICSSATLNLNVSATGGTLTYAWTGTGTFSSTTVANPSVTGAASGSYSVTVTNACGSTSGSTTVVVNTAPSFTSCPGNQTANAGSNCDAVVNYTAVATGSPAPTYSYAFTGATTGSGSGTGSGSAFNLGTTNVDVTATNTCGTVTCSFTVTVSDNTPPVITCAGNQTPTAGSSCTYTHSGTAWDATFTDNCSGGSVAYSLSGVTSGTGSSLNGVTFNLGATTVTWTATDAANNTATCSHTITVQAPEVNVTGNSVSIVDGDNTPDVADHTDFGAVATGATRTFTIENTGNSALNISSIAVSGTNMADFTVSGAPTSVAGGSSATFTVTFATVSAGNRTATITINNDDCDEAAYDFAIQASLASTSEINVKGNSVSIADGDNTPDAADHTDFGSVATGVTRTFTIENTGTGTLTISGITSSNSSEFAVSGAPSSVAPGASASFVVTFTPVTLNTTTTSTITINNNDADESVYDFSVQAFGIPTITNGSLGNQTAAYSLRKVNSNYNGNAIQVRRSCDNLTADIGFTVCGDLDTNALKAHVFGAPPLGSGSGAAMSYALRKIVCSHTGGLIRVRRSCDNAETDIGFTANGDLDTVALKNFVFGAGPLNMISTSANVAYSLRRMRCAYSGSAIRVRRSSDNTTQDIGFTSAGDLDTAALKTFVGANNGFVTIWYDQSGNAKNLSQASAGNQPQIVSSGNVLRQNGKPTVRFTATSTQTLRFAGTISSGSGAFSLFAISSRTNATLAAGSEIFGWGANTTFGSRIGLWNDINTGNNSLELLNRAKIGNSTTAGAMDLKTWIYTSGNISTGLTGYYNGSVISTTLFGGLDVTPNVASSEICMGAVPTTTAHPFDGNVSEVLGFTSALVTSERQILEYLQSTYYNISGPAAVSIGSTSADAYVTTWYDQSGSARNATQTTVANQPRIMNDGKIDRNNGKPTIVFDGVNDYFTHNSFPTSGFTGFTANMLVRWNTTGSSISNIQALMDNDHRCPSGPSSGLGFIVQDRPDFVNKPVTFAAPNSSSCNSLADNATTGNGSFRLLTFVNNGSSESIFRDGSQTATQTYSGTYIPQSRFVIGAWWNLGSVSRFMNGSMSEITIFPLGLNNADRKNLEYNQAVYYGITGPTTASSVNGPSGYVTTWYDQSGNGRNAVQATTANQPQIINNGQLVYTTQNRPAIRFGLNGNTSLVASGVNVTSGSNRFISSVQTITNYKNFGVVWANNNANNFGFHSNTSGIYYYDGGAWTPVSNSTTTFINSLQNNTAYLNGTSYYNFGTATNLNGLCLGNAGPVSAALEGNISEFIFINSYINNTRRTFIENDQAEYYGITISNDKFLPVDASYRRNMSGIGFQSLSDSVATSSLSGGLEIQDDVSSSSNFLRDAGDYIVAGVNCNTTPAVVSTNLSQNVQSRWITDWEIKKTDVNNNGGLVKFVFDFNKYWNGAPPVSPGAASQYVLLKRSTSNGTFDTLAVTSKVVSGSKVIFTLNAQNINTFFTIGTMNLSLSPLPVSLASQKAVWRNEDAVVTWTTASENNNSHFEVLRSINGQPWEKIGTVNSKSINGNSDMALSYAFLDRGMKYKLNGFVLYRILSMSLSGEAEQHAPMTLRNSQEKQSVQLMPNPTSGIVTVALNQASEQDANIQIWNTFGQKVGEFNFKAGSGQSLQTLDLSKFADGIYTVRVASGDLIHTEKLILKK